MVQMLEEFIPIYYLPCRKTYLIVSSLMVVPNDISRNKFHTTRPLDLEKKILDISNAFKSFGIAKIALSSVFSGKDLELKKRVVETNGYLIDLCGFHGCSVISKIHLQFHNQTLYIRRKKIHFGFF